MNLQKIQESTQKHLVEALPSWKTCLGTITLLTAAGALHSGNEGASIGFTAAIANLTSLTAINSLASTGQFSRTSLTVIGGLFIAIAIYGDDICEETFKIQEYALTSLSSLFSSSDSERVINYLTQ